MKLAANVFDVWVFQRRPDGIVFLLLHTSVEKAARYFNGGRFWQIPSDFVNNGESITDAISRALRQRTLSMSGYPLRRASRESTFGVPR